ncbi:MAG: hypothetical protein RMK57_12030 [Bryobacterales bacterium]|nr:hypothetical protein [Bryobacteraceae bacterium]MDW8355249.1 hypothetical protein [Bryobacterales bacterium]
MTPSATPDPDGLPGAPDASALLRRALTLAVEASPASLEQCALVLEEVSSRLREARRPPAGGWSEATALALRRHIERLAAILEHAAEFHRGWVRMRNALTAGYGCHGAPAEFSPEPRLRLEA